MSFTIRLGQDLTAVDAGATVPLSIEVLNKLETGDRYEIQVEGLDPEWTASPEPTFTVSPGETHSHKVFFKPPRASESVAGNYPYVVRVRSLESGDSRTVQGVLQVKSYNHLSMEISPKKGYVSPMRHQNVYGITIINLGNSEHTLQLTASDPEELCTFDFAHSEVTVGPGQQKVVEVVVNASRPSLVASSQLFGFVVSARSVQHPSVVASSQAQLEQRPLISLSGLALVLFLLTIFAVWFSVRPQPATIRLSAVDTSVVQNTPAVVSWDARNANSVRLEVTHNRDGKVEREVFEGLDLKGNRSILATDEDTLTVRAFAVADNKEASSQPVTISVQTPPSPNPPQILGFAVASRRVKLGEPVVFTFKFSPDVIRAVLAPTGQEIVAGMSSLEVTPTTTGSKTYELIAFNKEGGQAKKSVSVEIYQVSDANIIDFTATPLVVEAPNDRTKVTWRVSNASLVQLDNGTGTLQTVQAENVEGLEIITNRNLQLKLIATDSKGMTVSKRIAIKYKALPPPDPASTPGDQTTTGATTTGGGITTGGGG